MRRTRESAIEGPFAVEQINQMLRQKRLTFKSLAFAETGQGLQAVQDAPIKQWSKVADIPGYEPDEERNCLSIALMILIVVVIAVVIGLMKVMDYLSRIK